MSRARLFTASIPASAHPAPSSLPVLHRLLSGRGWVVSGSLEVLGLPQGRHGIWEAAGRGLG